LATARKKARAPRYPGAESAEVSDDNNIEKWPLRRLVNAACDPTASPTLTGYYNGEISRRVAQAQIDAAKYMRWSVMALAITAGATAIFKFLARLFPNPLHFR